MIEKQINFESLLHCLQADSKAVIDRICQAAFAYRHVTDVPTTAIESISSDLKIDQTESVKVMKALQTLINFVVFGTHDAASIAKLFPADFHKNLRELLTKIIVEHLPEWKNSAVDDLVSLPRLAKFDWRVDIKTASSSLSRMAVPTCLMQLQIENGAAPGQLQQSHLSSVTVELSRETLDTMLDGLGRIRDQLSSVARS